MYGKAYLDWCEGEACAKDLKRAAINIRDKHGQKAYEYAVEKLYPETRILPGRPIPVLGGIGGIAAQQQAAMSQQGWGPRWPFGGLLG